MPKDTIERAVKRGSGGGDDANYEEVRYEGYGPGGVAIIVEALTDNRNRTASEVRSAFTKHGGSLGETNSVSFMFERKGVVRYPAAVGSGDIMFEAALEAGADNVESDKDSHEVTCAPEDFAALRDALERRFGPPQEARLQWRPLNSIPVDAETASSLLKLLDVLEDNDDVQSVSANFDVAEDVIARLTA
jgi:YebC/PmpR family DNA-binding regulatory protein